MVRNRLKNQDKSTTKIVTRSKKQSKTKSVSKQTKNAIKNTINTIELKRSDQKVENFNLIDYLNSNSSWMQHLEDEFNKDYLKELNKNLNNLYATCTVYPAKELIFNAFNLTDFEKIKVVILGQDPYHDEGQAHGLAFSVQRGVDIPRSLKNIYKELESDISEFKAVQHGCLEDWCKEGVFLLNAILTVEAHKPGSHSKIGWQTFTDKVIQLISEQSSYCVFILWGNIAQKQEALIDHSKHGIIKCAHPSPQTCTKFLNSKCFSKANELLKEHGKEPISWHLTA